MFHYAVLHDKFIKKRAQDTLLRFIRFKSQQENFTARVREMFFHVTFIQRKYRGLRTVMNGRCHALRYPILSHLTFLINNDLLGENTEKSKQMRQKVERLSDGKKDFVTECIIGMAKLEFRKEFLLWFSEHRLDEKNREEFVRKREIKVAVKNTKDQQMKLMNFISDLATYDKGEKLKQQIIRRRTVGLDIQKYISVVEDEAGKIGKEMERQLDEHQ